MDTKYIVKQIRQETISDPELFSRIGTRFVPRRVDFGQETIEYPLISFVFADGAPDIDNYPSDIYSLEVYYVSDKSIDEAISLYDRWVTLLNRQRYSKADGSFMFEIREMSKGEDFSGIFNEKILYVFSNMMMVRTVG